MNLKNKFLLKNTTQTFPRIPVKKAIQVEDFRKKSYENLINGCDLDLSNESSKSIDACNDVIPEVVVTQQEYISIESDEGSCTLKDDIKPDSHFDDGKITKHDLSMNILQRDTDKDVSDLQALLVMMALTAKPAENTDKTPLLKEITSETPFVKDNTNVIKASKAHTNDTTFLNIIPMRVDITDHQTALLKKVVTKWKNYAQKKKKHLMQQRQETLNTFFENLEKRKTEKSLATEPAAKAKLLGRDCSTYQHRYKIQKHIIAIQKAKLEEQSRVIDELKYNKILQATQVSVEAMREEVRRTYFEMDRQLKPKLKCLTNELNIHEIEEPSLVLHCLKVPQFLQRMEKRAREREEKHALIRERRKQMEEERVRLKQQNELAKEFMDKEEKLKRMKELREKRKREKVENIRKKQHAERMRALMVMADLHYERNLMTKYGIRPLKLLIEMKRDNMDKAKAHKKFQLKKNVFLNWMWHTEDMWYERNYRAEDFRRKKLLRKYFNGFYKNHYEFVLKMQVAEDYYDLYVMQLVFRKLREAILFSRKENEMKFHKAVIYHNSNLLFKSFICWRALPALNAIKREQEVRKARWREKVLQVVPDYAPPED